MKQYANLSIEAKRPLSLAHIRSLTFAWGIGNPSQFGKLVIEEINSPRRIEIVLATNASGYLSDPALELLERALSKMKTSPVTGQYSVVFETINPLSLSETR
jgi:hypothetical protein